MEVHVLSSNWEDSTRTKRLTTSKLRSGHKKEHNYESHQAQNLIFITSYYISFKLFMIPFSI